MSTRKTRIKDIANLSGVSIGTVDRVLHNRGEVAENTRLRVQKYLRETNYSPNVVAQVLKSNYRYHIVTLLPEPTEINSYWLKHPEGIIKALQDPFPLAITQITFDLQSEKDFLKKTEEVLKLNPDGVLLAPIFKNESMAFSRVLNKKKIPFVFIDGLIESAKFMAYIGENTIKSGRVAGQLIDMVTDKNKDILIVNIARNIKNIHHLEKRTEGFLGYFKKHCINTGRKVAISIADPSQDIIKKEMDKAFNENPEIASIFISGSKSYLIAIYLKEKGLKSINLIGYDLLELNVKFLKQGIIKFLIGQRPDEQTYKGIKKLTEYLTMNKLPERIEYLPVDIVTSENVDFFVK